MKIIILKIWNKITHCIEQQNRNDKRISELEEMNFKTD